MYLFVAPPPRLSPWVQYLWELVPGELDQWQEYVPAELQTDLVVSLGEPYIHLEGAAQASLSGLQYFGQRQRPECFAHQRSNHLLGVRLKTGAAHQLFGWRGAALRGRLTADDEPLRAFSDLPARLGEHLPRSSRTTPRIDAGSVQETLLAPVQRALPTLSDAPVVPRLLELAARERCFRVQALARRVGMTERTLERRFNDELGVSPKFALRLLRAERAREALDRGQSAASVAHAWGFCDQPHLSSELRTLLGSTAQRRLPRPRVCRVSPRPGQP